MPAPARLALLVLALAGVAPAARAQAPPNMQRQDAWGPAEKKEFLKYLRSNQSEPASGEVRTVSASQESGYIPRKARYATLNLATDTLFSVAGDGRVIRESTGLGPKLLVGGHLFSWIRFYSGIQYTALSQGLTDGSRTDVSHWQAPLGLELALIPLGTPHTRYVLLRAGVAAHYFSSPTPKDRFNAPLLGWQSSWNMGLGYEWQLENTPWRVHALAEGSKSMNRHGAAPFYGVGFTTGIVRTF